jgi:hypothetical protein
MKAYGVCYGQCKRRLHPSSQKCDRMPNGLQTALRCVPGRKNPCFALPGVCAEILVTKDNVNVL